MKKKNILFVCVHNVFRSKVAEAYFNKMNKNENISVSSAGIVKPNILSEPQKKVIKLQRGIAKELGINMQRDSKQLNISLLKKQDIIIIAADDITEKIFSDPYYLKPNLKVIVWKIPDVKREKDDKLVARKSIKNIMGKVDKLVEKLK